MQGKTADPSCLCGMIPSLNSYRMQGLWSKSAGKNIEDSIRDADPKQLARKHKNTPVGLTNLGNTCYINSVLQCLFAIDDFKIAILGASNPQLHENKVFQSLKNIFLQMECGPRNYVDPEPLISALRLDSSVQQDGQEFMKLFLTLLEKSFEGIPELEQKIQKMFRGRVGYQTKCLTCQNLSQSSLRFDDFSELDIPIKGHKSLEESLGALLAPEILDGDNQYFCAHCNAKRDAMRQLVIRALPPYLCLSLQRFVFDLKKMDRIKASDKFSFPLELDSSIITHNHQEHRTMYDLEGILLHKGNSARQGHYVAHVGVNVKGKSKNVWYRFDDTDVSKLESGSHGHSDHGCRPKLPQGGTSANEKALSVNYDKQDLIIDLAAAENNQDQLEVPKIENGQQKEMPDNVISSNAYLLVYKLRDPSKNILEKRDETLSRWLDQQRDALDAEYKQECERYEKIVAETQRDVDARKDIIRNAIDRSKALAIGDSGSFVTLNWLDKWVNAEPKESVPPADNTALLCNHGSFDPSRVQASKRLASNVYEQIVKTYGGGPSLSLQDICKLCLLEQLNSIIVAEDVVINREKFVDMCHALDVDDQDENRKLEMEGGFFVGRHWLRNWRNRKGLSMGTTSPTASLVCQHGMLSPEQPGKASKRVLIPEDFWKYLKRCWIAQNAEKNRKLRFKEAEKGHARKELHKAKICQAVSSTNTTGGTENGSKMSNNDHGRRIVSKLDDTSRIREFIRGCPECEECKAEVLAEISMNEKLGLKREEERSALKHLIPSSQNISLERNVIYKMVPTRFLRDWRLYMNHSGKGKTAPDEPVLGPSMKSVACLSHTSDESCSEMISYSSPNVINRRGRWMATNDMNCAFEIIQESDWIKLWSIYGNAQVPFGSDGISAFLSIKDSEIFSASQETEENRAQTCLHPQGEEKSEASNMEIPAAGDVTTSDGILKAVKSNEENLKVIKSTANIELITSPGVCLKCIHERQQAIHASMLNYEGKGIMVELVTSEDTAIDDTTTTVASTNSLNNISSKLQIQNIDAHENVLSIQERKSKRARKGRSPVMVDSSTSLGDLKLRIFEALGVHPKNIRAFAKGMEMTDDSKSMLQYEILPMEEIRIIDTLEYDAADLGSIFPGMLDSSPNHDDRREEGFTGTALVG